METIYIEVDRVLVILSLMISAIYMIVLGTYIWVKSHGGQVVKWFIYGLSLFLIWITFHIFELNVPTIQHRWVIVCIQYFAICYLGLTFYMFSRSYSGQKRLSKRGTIAVYALPTFLYVSALTNPLHRQFYTHFYIDGEVYGPLCWLSIVMTFVYLVMGVYEFTKNIENRSIYIKKQMVYFGLSGLIPLIIHFVTAFRIVDFGFNIVLVVLPFSLTLITISVLKYQFLDILPYALTEVVDNIDDGFLVVNNDRDIEDYNALFFDKLFDIGKCRTFDDVLGMMALTVRNKAILDNLNYSLNVKNDNYVSGEITMAGKKTEITVQYTTKAITDIHGVKIATIITFHDITEIQRLYEELEIRKRELMTAKRRLEEHISTVQQLSIENERNKLMSEVHDTLGHTMTELLALMEKCDIILSKEGNEEEFIVAVLEGTLLRARESLAQIRAAVSRFKKMGVEL